MIVVVSPGPKAYESMLLSLLWAKPDPNTPQTVESSKIRIQVLQLGLSLAWQENIPSEKKILREKKTLWDVFGPRSIWF